MPLLYSVFVGIVGLFVGGSIAYLLTLLLAAARASPWQRQGRGPNREEGIHPAAGFRVAVVIPAHDEELVLGATLESLRVQEYPSHLFEVVVVADNCTDATAEVARTYGVSVLERANASERGKGYALEWALSLLRAAVAPADAFVIVDADTWVAPDFLSCMVRELAERTDSQGYCALQGRYGVLNAGEGWRAALMAAALDLANHVRPLGRTRLGLSVGLKGNGMAFTRPVLERAPWQGHSITEDIDYGLDLLCHHGLRVGYVPEAQVLAQMPTTAGQAASQRERWESGRYRLLRERALPLLQQGIRRMDLRLVDAAVDLIVPPLAELAALLTLWGVLIAAGHAAGLLAGHPWWYGAFGLCALGLAVYVLGGLRVAGAPRAAYAALLRAPFYAVWKLALYTRGLLRRREQRPGAPPEWVRTERTPISTNSEPIETPSAPRKPAG